MKIKNKILSFIFINLGFYFCIIFIYIYFLRERLPKIIPLELTELSFYSIIFLLTIYLYAIKQNIYYKPPSLLSLQIISTILSPFVFFDAFIKHNKIIYPYYYKLFCYISKIAKDSFIFSDRVLVFIILKIIPRIILLAIFFVDVFWLHKIEIFYYFILLGIFPLFYNYFKYSVEFALEEYIKYLESYYTSVLLIEKGNFRMNDMFISSELNEEDDEIFGTHNPKAVDHDKFVTIREYIEIQAEIIINFHNNNENVVFEYSGSPAITKEIFEQFLKDNKRITRQLNEEDDEKLKQLFNMLEFKLITLYVYLHFTKKIQELAFIKKINLFIYISYFIIWIYIFLISLHNLENIPLTLKILEVMTEYSNILNPFS